MLFQEYQRIILDNYSDLLKQQGIACALTLVDSKSANDEMGIHDGDYIMRVLVPGPEKQPASFYLSFGNNHGADSVMLNALYFSDALPEGHTNSWYIDDGDDPGFICESLILDFVQQCFYKEHEKYVSAELVNDANLDEFIPMMRDADLVDPDIYVLGIHVNELDLVRAAGIASFRLNDGLLIIDYLYVLPEYRNLGIATYIADYIKETVTASGYKG